MLNGSISSYVGPLTSPWISPVMFGKPASLNVFGVLVVPSRKRSDRSGVPLEPSQICHPYGILLKSPAYGMMVPTENGFFSVRKGDVIKIIRLRTYWETYWEKILPMKLRDLFYFVPAKKVLY